MLSYWPGHYQNHSDSHVTHYFNWFAETSEEETGHDDAVVDELQAKADDMQMEANEAANCLSAAETLPRYCHCVAVYWKTATVYMHVVEIYKQWRLPPVSRVYFMVYQYLQSVLYLFWLYTYVFMFIGAYAASCKDYSTQTLGRQGIK